MAEQSSSNLLKTTTTGAKTVGVTLHRYRTIVIAVVALAVVGYSIYSISDLLDPQLDQSVYDEQISASQPVSFDQDAVEAIRELEDPAGPVRSQLPSNRNNPFEN